MPVPRNKNNNDYYVVPWIFFPAFPFLKKCTTRSFLQSCVTSAFFHNLSEKIINTSTAMGLTWWRNANMETPKVIRNSQHRFIIKNVIIKNSPEYAHHLLFCAPPTFIALMGEAAKTNLGRSHWYLVECYPTEFVSSNKFLSLTAEVAHRQEVVHMICLALISLW